MLHAAWLALAAASSGVVATTTFASYAVRAVTALAAAAVFLRAARREDGLSATRRLVAAALLAGAVSGGAAALIALVTGTAAPLGSWTDWLQLSYVPFAVAGLVAIPAGAGERLRTLADAAVAGGALWYLTVAVLLEPGHIGAGMPRAARLVTFGYLLGPLVVAAVAVSLIPRTAGGRRSLLLRSAAGAALLSAADLWFASSAWAGTYSPASWIAGLHQAGLVVLLHAATATRRTDPRTATTTGPRHPAGEALLPYLPLAAAVMVALGQYVQGDGFTRAQTLPLILVGAVTVVRHGASARAHALLVQDLERREQDARRASLSDALTGLANRTALLHELERALADPAAHPVAVAVLDLNDFKHVNDSHGHETGDRLLEAVAARLRDALPPGCVTARLGGDEFAVCQRGAGDAGAALVDGVAAAFDQPFLLGQRRFSMHPSVGVVLDERRPGAGRPADAANLLAHADLAMYQAKAGKGLGPAPAVVLTGHARERASTLLQMHDDINDPSLDQFHVLYQPIVHLGTGQLVGVEALLRWHHPTLGEVSPAVFIPLAEQAGSVAVLGAHALTTALADLAVWNRLPGPSRLSVAVNLSPPQLADPDLPTSVLAALTASRVAPTQLVVEITEGALLRHLDVAADVVADLRTAGVSVSVDDFGTGHSSLSSLRRFAADTIKIDGGLVQAMPAEERTAALVRLVVEMAAALGLRTVAEGIESPAQLRGVQALGCDEGQGFLFCGPVDAQHITDLVRRGHRYPVLAPVEGAEGEASPPPSTRVLTAG